MTKIAMGRLAQVVHRVNSIQTLEDAYGLIHADLHFWNFLRFLQPG